MAPLGVVTGLSFALLVAAPTTLSKRSIAIRAAL